MVSQWTGPYLDKPTKSAGIITTKRRAAVIQQKGLLIMPSFHVNVKAIACHDNGNGTFTLKMDGQALPEAELKMLEKRFPRTFHKVEELLAQEALLDSFATREDMEAKPSIVVECRSCGDSFRELSSGPTTGRCPTCTSKGKNKG